MKKFLGKKSIMTFMVLALVFSIAGVASASTPPPSGLDAVKTSIESEFGSIQTIAIGVLAALATIAIVLFGGIYAWRYGKKVFSIIAK